MPWVVVLVLLGACRYNFDQAIDDDDPRIATLDLRSGSRSLTTALVPAFAPDLTSYTLDVGIAISELQLSAAPVVATTSIEIAGAAVPTGELTAPVGLALGSSEISVSGMTPSGAMRTYSIEVRRASTIAQDVYLKASNAGPAGVADEFGYSIAISNDTIAIGGRMENSGVGGNQDDESKPQAGAVYVFVQVAGTWTQQAYLKAPNVDAGDRFGGSVALSGDTLVVGARFEDCSCSGVFTGSTNEMAADSGAAYVFVRSAGVWSPQAYLKASNTQAGDEFGFSVAIDGDTIAVSAPQEDGLDDGLADSGGAVYVYDRTGATWTQRAYLRGSQLGPDHQFGRALALEATTLVIGAWLDNVAAAQSGAVYVFEPAGTTWTETAYLKTATPTITERFGTSVAISGDTLAIGASGDDTVAPVSGAAYVFTRTAGTWTQQAYLKASNPGADDELGLAIALDGDVLAVGAQSEKSLARGIDGDQLDNSSTVPVPAGGAGPSGPGAVYLFTRAAGAWSQRAYLKASNTVDDNTPGSGAPRGNQFGNEVALDGGILAVGALYEDAAGRGVNADQLQPGPGAGGAAENSGAVYVFH